ncbi:MAG TPA: FadR/GntR family transcriptional regulator [Acidimicrobiales bacterium]|nr:FadR/GntR family transcriptional regulator [Acidimicrobiales bacterium]
MRNGRPPKFAHVVAQRIVAEILDNELTPGDMLPPERVMLERYDVSRGVLREALRYLEMQEVIRVRPGPGGGPMVTAPDSQSLAITLSLLLAIDRTAFGSVLEARETLEPTMAALAAERATPEQLAELEQIVAETREAVADLAAFLRLSRAFHDAIAGAVNNSVFELLGRALHLVMASSAGDREYSVRRRREVAKVHADVFEAIRDRDPDRADAMMRHDLTRTYHHLTRANTGLLERRMTWRDIHQ